MHRAQLRQNPNKKRLRQKDLRFHNRLAELKSLVLFRFVRIANPSIVTVSNISSRSDWGWVGIKALTGPNEPLKLILAVVQVLIDDKVLQHRDGNPHQISLM